MAGEWETTLLRDLLVTTKDGDWGKENPEDGYLPYHIIRGTDFPDVRVGDLSSVPQRYLPEHTVKRRTLEADDILIETAGGTRDRPTGRTLLITEKVLSRFRGPATCASFARFLRIDRKQADPRFVFWYLQHLYDKGEMSQHQVQHTGVARFQYTRFAETQNVPLPPLAEQKAIAAVLGALDDKIELNRRMNATLEAMARALFQSWFVDFDPVRAKLDGRQPNSLDPATAALFPEHLEDSLLGHIPKGWEVCSLANKIELLSGGTPKTAEPDYWDGDIPWYSVKDAPSEADVWVIQTEKQVTKLGIENSAAQVLPEGTAIISARGTVGKLALVGTPMAMNQSCYGVRGAKGYADYFTYFALRQATADLQQRTHGTVFDTITRQTFETLDCIFPPVPLTQAFDRTVAPLLAQIRANLHESRTLATLRDTLLPKLLSGELSVASLDTQ